MSDELFEVVFSGQIKDGADLEQVKVKVAAMFKADSTKLAHLFSGKHVVIKKNIDLTMANKYKVALDNAGAVCEIKSLSENVQSNPSIAATAPAPAAPPQRETPAAEPVTNTAAVSDTFSGDAPAAPQTNPLGIMASKISDLSATLAPVGSDMQDEIEPVAEPQLDLSGMDMAPAGSDLGEIKKPENPPPPNTDGLSLVD